MPETIIESALTAKLDWDLLSKWLNNESIEAAPEDCILLCSNRNEFVSYFLSYIRNQTDSILQTNSNALPLLQHQGTPEKSLGQRKHHRSISDPTCDNDKSNDNLTVKSERKTHESPNRDRKKQGKRVKTKLFSEDKKETSLSSDESRITVGVERLILSSTPIKNGFKSDFPNLPSSSPVTPQSRSFKEFERCDTPRISRHSRSQEKSVSLGDYLVNVQSKNSKKKRSKNTSNDDSETKVDLDLSNSEIFPEIGARKSSSLKSERRRIKPTNIDRSQKSYSLNFTPDTFQQSPLALEENLAFKPKLQNKESNGIEIERNILKQERHKLMEKFNILNTSMSPKVCTPQIKITQKESLDKNVSYIDADSSKIVFSDKIDILVDIYDILLKNNLILSVHTEVYFLITILLSKQIDDDYNLAESQLPKNLTESILKPIHNSTYFAVKALWNQRGLLDVILDKNSLKILGENKKVRSFFPDLAKFLLNSYGLKCEAENNSERTKTLTIDSRCSNGMVCFNHETDNAENFPSILSFQNFKKQRDMFYEILRWYSEGGGRSGLRARSKALLALGAKAANHAHLAALMLRLLLDTLPPTRPESKLSKLQRRLTCPSVTESHRLPHFNDKEMFYKEFIMYAENESFRTHMKDTFISEIIALDSTPIGNESSNSSDTSKEFIILSKKLHVLAKFLGYLTSLPYVHTSIDILLKTGVIVNNNQKDEIFQAPKEKVLENNIALRNHTQPPIDLIGLLNTAIQNGRIIITVPWITHYLSLLDYTTLRLKYYQSLITILFQIYESKLSNMKKNTTIYIKSVLGWLFDLPHFPQELYYQNRYFKIEISNDVFDSGNIIDESMLFDLCPFLKDINVLLSTSRVSEKESFRHITPVSLSVNSEDRIRNKEKELQSRLEEEMLRSQPSSSRRVLELVSERVSSASIRELTGALALARQRARTDALGLVSGAGDRATLIASLQTLYTEHLDKLRSDALQTCKTTARARVSAALSALLPSAPAPLHALATRTCYNRLSKWITDHWNTTAVLCKDIEEELISLQAGEAPTRVLPQTPTDTRTLLSPAATLIALKEQICLLLDYEDIQPPDTILQACVNCCSPVNIFSRAPTLRAILQLSIDFCIVYGKVIRGKSGKSGSAVNTVVNPSGQAVLAAAVNKKEYGEVINEGLIQFGTRMSRKPSQITTVLPDLHTLWETCCPERQSEDALDDTVSTPDRDNPGERVIEQKPDQESNLLLDYFNRILCPRNIVLLSESRCSPSEVWKAIAEVMVFLLNNRYLSEDSLTEQCLAVYRQDWPQNILENLSTCMKSVSARWSRSSTGKFTLFLDFLANYCNDMDYDLVE